MLQMRKGLLSFLILSLILAACTAAATPEQGAAPDSTPTPQPTATPRPTAAASATPAQGGETAAPVEAARRELARRLDIAPSEITVSSTEEMQWPDACLGLAEQGEMCAQVITPGYLIVLRAEGQVYEARTDRQGSVVRLQETAEPQEEYPAAVLQARMALAAQLNVDAQEITVLSYEERQWNDACLGLAGPDEMCAQVITPGWLVMLQAQGQTYEVHTDASGDQVRVADLRRREPASAGDAVVILTREGGIAGERTEWRLYPSGTIEVLGDAPARDAGGAEAQVDPARIEALVAEIEETGFFDLRSSYLPDDTCCDRFTYTLTVKAGGRTHTVRAIEASPDTPDAVWQSVALVQQVVEDGTGAPER